MSRAKHITMMCESELGELAQLYLYQHGFRTDDVTDYTKPVRDMFDDVPKTPFHVYSMKGYFFIFQTEQLVKEAESICFRSGIPVVIVNKTWLSVR